MLNPELIRVLPPTIKSNTITYRTVGPKKPSASEFTEFQNPGLKRYKSKLGRHGKSPSAVSWFPFYHSLPQKQRRQQTSLRSVCYPPTLNPKFAAPQGF